MSGRPEIKWFDAEAVLPKRPEGGDEDDHVWCLVAHQYGDGSWALEIAAYVFERTTRGQGPGWLREYEPGWGGAPVENKVSHWAPLDYDASWNPLSELPIAEAVSP